MKILISKEALTGKDNDLLWSGALYGLKRLQQFDYEIAFNGEELSQNQQQLLENEQIISDDFSRKETDLLIRVANSTLKVFTPEDDPVEEADDWIALSNKICFPTRKAFHQRKTSETDILIELNLDGTGKSDISTGLGFFDHMLEQIAKHGLIDLNISCDGDLHVDEHHTIEDVAITLGETITQALDDKVGVQRYGFTLPMDETLANIAVDLSGRPYLLFDATFDREKVGDFPTEMVEHFFYSLAMHLKATIHISVGGQNDHHKIEACFKGFARCLRAAVSRSERNANVLPSSKGLL